LDYPYFNTSPTQHFTLKLCRSHDCHVKMSSEKFESLEDDLDSVLDNLKDRVESKIVHFEGG
jgi:NADH:ubiquinone oxidoreductase subunit E